jgi:hypothetical protein
MLKEYSRYNDIVSFVEKNPKMVQINGTLGYVDLEMQVIVRNLGEVHDFIESIMKQFPNAIRSYSYFCLLETHKFMLLDLESLE